ncbi:MAG: efflux RND transporter periplasmic adaptor subunit [Bacteroidia bacterium]|nr:efflux RND transporter periplasmic adaptor subunit [Bacteroidia bacterium]
MGTDVPVYRIASLNPAYAEISVPETEIGKLKVGQEALVVVPTLNRQTFSGIVKIIPPVADPQTRTFSVKILVDNPNYVLKGGMISEVSLMNSDMAAPKTLSIPSQAILKSPDEKSYVFVANLDKKEAQRRKISVGRVQGEAVEVLNGLQNDEWIIVAGQHKLRDGQKIQVSDKKLVSSK